MPATLAITGTTGFVGQHLLDTALGSGHTVRALTRRPQPPRAGVIWVEGALDRLDRLRVLATGADAVIHVAGAINAPSRAAFLAANAGGTSAMLAAARAAGTTRFLQVSSLAAREPALSDYGHSKAAADAAVEASPLAWTIVRPPAVYGPGDRETLELFRLACRGLIPVAGAGRLSLIEVGDLARALIALATHPAPRAIYEVDDGGPPRTQAAFARAVATAVGRQARIVPVPTAVLTPAAAIATLAARATGRAPKLSRDRARYFAHPDWTADSAPLRALGLWSPTVPLGEGLAATAAWYRAQGWL